MEEEPVSVDLKMAGVSSGTSPPYQILQKIFTQIKTLTLLSDVSIYYRTNCRNWAVCMRLLWSPFQELQDINKPLSSKDLSTFNNIEFVLRNMKDVLEMCAGKCSKSIVVLNKQKMLRSFQDLSERLYSSLTSLGLEAFHLLDHTQEQIEKCINHLQTVDFCIDALEEELSGHIKIALAAVEKQSKLSHEILVEVANKLELKSNQDILREASFLERERIDAHTRKDKNEEDHIEMLIDLVTQIADDLAEQKQAQARHGGIPIPPEFRCPLSLELMADPVIIASGQTYERTYIQHWFDEGNTTCPKSRQPLTRFNLTPNYNVKALIINWCEENGTPVPGPVKKNFEKNMDKAKESRTLSGSNGKISLESTENNLAVDTVSTSKHEVFGTNSQIESSRMDETGEPDLHSSTSTNSSENLSDASNSRRHFIAGNVVGFGKGEYNMDRCLNVLKTHSSSSRKGQKINGSGSLIPATVGVDDDSVQVQVQTLVQDIQSPSQDVQRTAVQELRLLSKHSMENRIIIARCGGIRPLVSLLCSTDPDIQENAVTALLNISINNNNKSEIAENNVIDPLVHVLKFGTSEAKENAAATLFSLSNGADSKSAIGQSGAIPLLVELLRNGSPRGKKDAVTALFNLSMEAGNKSRIVQADAVKPLISLMSDPALGMVEKAAAVIQNLAHVTDGRNAIVQEGGIPVLAEVVETGSERGKEHSAAALYNLCSNNPRFRAMVFSEGVTPSLTDLSRTGSARAKEKANSLLRLFKEHMQQGSSRNGNRRH